MPLGSIALRAFPAHLAHGDVPGACLVPRGAVLIRVVDTDRTAGNLALDTVFIDELFVRSLP